MHRPRLAAPGHLRPPRLLTSESLAPPRRAGRPCEVSHGPGGTFPPAFDESCVLEAFHGQRSHPAPNTAALSRSRAPAGAPFGEDSRSGFMTQYFFLVCSSWHRLVAACWNRRFYPPGSHGRPWHQSGSHQPSPGSHPETVRVWGKADSRAARGTRALAKPMHI